MSTLRHNYDRDEEQYGNAHEHGMVGGHGASLSPGQVAAIMAKLKAPGMKKGGTSGSQPGKLSPSAKSVAPIKPGVHVTTPSAKAPAAKAPTRAVSPRAAATPKPAKAAKPLAHAGGHKGRGSHSPLAAKGHELEKGAKGIAGHVREAAHLANKAVSTGTMTQVANEQMFEHEGGGGHGGKKSHKKR